MAIPQQKKLFEAAHYNWFIKHLGPDIPLKMVGLVADKFESMDRDFNKEWFLSEMWSVNEEHNQHLEEYANSLTKMESVE